MTSEDEVEIEGPSVVAGIAAVSKAVGAVAKSNQTSGGGPSYKYRGIDDLIKALHIPMAEAGLVIVPKVEDYQRIEEDGYWSRTILTVRFRVYGPSGDFVDAIGVGEGRDNSDKGPGKAMSYAYKTAISQLFCIPTDDPAMDNEYQAPPGMDKWLAPQLYGIVRSDLRERSQALPEGDLREELADWIGEQENPYPAAVLAEWAQRLGEIESMVDQAADAIEEAESD